VIPTADGAQSSQPERVIRWHTWAIVSTLCPALAVACTGTTLVMTNPPNARVTVDGVPLTGNSFRYGRWVGNSYEIEASAPSFRTERRVARVELGDRAGAIALACVGSVFGIPFLPVVLWNGELDDRMYISMAPEIR